MASVGYPPWQPPPKPAVPDGRPCYLCDGVATVLLREVPLCRDCWDRVFWDLGGGQ